LAHADFIAQDDIRHVRGNFAPEKHYLTMSTEEICALNVRALREKNCALFLWATMPALPEALKVMEAWGFKYKTCAFSWIKTRADGQPIRGMGSYTKSNIEVCLLGMRGHIKAADKTVPQVVMHPRLGHSVKPPIVRDRIVQLFGDLTRIELFARQQAEGWDAAGLGIDGISLEEKLELISSPDYVFQAVKGIKKAVKEKNGQQPVLAF